MRPALERFELALVDASKRLSQNPDLAQPGIEPALPRPRTVRRRRSRLAVLGTALTGGIVAAVVVLSSGTTAAYAGWTAVPARATAMSIAAARRICDTGYSSFENGVKRPTNFFVGPPLLSETRGVSQALVSVKNGDLYLCLTSDNPHQKRGTFSTSVHQFGRVRAAPGPDQLSAPYRFQTGVGFGNDPAIQRKMIHATPAEAQRLRAILAGGGYGPSVLGQAGSDISAVTINFGDGKTVTATVENGWYFAWWPWANPPESITATTSAGTVTSPVTSVGNARNWLLPACRAGTRGCVFSGAS